MRDVVNHEDRGLSSNDIITETNLESHKATAYVLRIYGENEVNLKS